MILFSVNPKMLLFRRFTHHGKSIRKLTQADINTYQRVIDGNNLDCVENIINKGFALLNSDWRTYGHASKELFGWASLYDKDKKYTEEIECGKKQADNALNPLHSSEERCFHVVYGYTPLYRKK